MKTICICVVSGIQSFIMLLVLSSCSSLQADVGETEQPKDPPGYAEARNRWPWAKGSQLKRRSEILLRSPTAEQLALLDESSDVRVELQVLAKVGSLEISQLHR